jgi:pSer/pThr/pTyr-binding forkhead associated (FHA) protein
MVTKRTPTDMDGPSEWSIYDDLIHLRRWASNVIYTMPPCGQESVIGSANGCWLQLQDGARRVSRQHASLSYCSDRRRWVLCDLKAKNGMFVDGARRMSCALEPGMEIGVGRITLVAESALLCVLRELLARILGWGMLEDVDLALRAVRRAAMRRSSLLLCGEGNLISTAMLLHNHTLGPQKPFIVCDPRRKSRAVNAGQAPVNYTDGMTALEAARGGTLCVWRERPPRDFLRIETAIKDPQAPRVQLIVCTHLLPREPGFDHKIVIPRPTQRAHEIDRIIDAYAMDAVVNLNGFLPADDREWVRKNASQTLDEIETSTRRLVAIRGANNSVSRAAIRLRMSHGALSTWFARRKQLSSKSKLNTRR